MKLKKYIKNIILPKLQKFDSTEHPKIKRWFINIEYNSLICSEYNSLSSIEETQLEKLKKVLESAFKIPYWKEKIPSNFTIKKAFKGLEKISLTTKKHIQENFPERMVNLTLPKERRYLDHTSGSTGEPLLYYRDTAEKLYRLASYKRILNRLGFQEKDTLIRLMKKDHMGLENFHTFTQSKGDENLDESLLNFYREFLTTNMFSVIHLYASYALRLAQLLKENDLPIPKLKGIICTSEAISPNERRCVEEIFSCPLILHYGMREVGFIADSCTEDKTNGLHINAEYFIVEICDMNGYRLPNGERGHVVVTSLCNMIAPLIRYDTGDIGYITKDACLCGRTLPRVYIEGKSADVITLPNGKNLNPFSLNKFFNKKRDHIKQFQVIRTDVTTFEVYVIPLTSKEDFSNLKKELENVLQSTVLVKKVTHIPHSKTGKRKFFISRI